MTKFTGFDAANAVTMFLATSGNTLPEHQRDHLVACVSASDMLRSVITGVEVLYASRAADGFPTEGIELMRDLALFVEQQNFYGMGMSGRARDIITVAERILAGGDTEVEGDPECDTKYCATEPEVEVVETENVEDSPSPSEV